MNGVEMKMVKIVPNMLDVCCLNHALDQIGEHFNTPRLGEFVSN